MKNYYAFYEVIGSRCNGSYFVQADTKREAKKKIAALDEDYCRIVVMNEKEYADELCMEDDEMKEELERFVANVDHDGIFHIESGT